MRSLSALQDRAQILLDQARASQPQKRDEGFIFSRELFTSQEYTRLEKFLAEVRPLYQWYSNGWVNYHALSDDQLDQLLLWAMLQQERSLKHGDHAAIILQWLNTLWSDQAAQLLALEKQHDTLPNAPYTYAFSSQLRSIEQGMANTIHNGYRREIRSYLLQREQGIDFEPCICKKGPGR